MARRQKGPIRRVDPASYHGESPSGVAGFVVRTVWSSHCDYAYRCRIVIGKDAGSPDPWYVVVSAGLRSTIGPAVLPHDRGLGPAAMREECFRDQKFLI